MSKENCGGRIVKEYDGFFLRDDSDIRENARIEPVEAYSLFREDPYGRVEVFAGSEDWAIQQADKLFWNFAKISLAK